MQSASPARLRSSARVFSRASAALGFALLLVEVTFVLCAAGCASPSPARPYLQAALRTASWIRAQERLTRDGKLWPSDLEQPGEDLSLYHGSCGVVLFFVELYESTADETWRREAQAGADHLLASIAAAEITAPGLYTGIAGIGFALLEVARITGEARYRDGARQCVELLTALARSKGAGVEWGDVTDIISGNAGIGLFLMRASGELDDPAALRLATAAGRRLLELGEEMPVGKDWAMAPTFPRRMPNFSHGTAGVGYFLGTLYLSTGEEPFREGALAAGRYLQSVAETSDGGGRVFHHTPGGEDLYYLGWCHGPAGTARLFYRLYSITHDPEWMEWVRRGARSIEISGIPEVTAPGFWNNVGQCCGAAGVGELFLSLHRLTGETDHLISALRVADDILARSTSGDPGLKWVQAEHRVEPENLQAQTGYMQGAAGIGSFLLHLDRQPRTRLPSIVFPDAPY